MAEIAAGLFPPMELPVFSAEAGATGILPFQTIREFVRAKEIVAEQPIDLNQIQPASIDLRLGRVAYRVPASFLPGTGATVMEKVRAFSSRALDISDGAVLERGCVYIVPLLERLNLTTRISALANPKSSTGRLDIFTRLITDNAMRFDTVEAGYEGPLYAEIAPKTFAVVVRTGSRLNQIRFRRGSPTLGKTKLQKLQEDFNLVRGSTGTLQMRDDSIGLTLDLRGDPRTGLIGYKARRHTDSIDIDQRDFYEIDDYWEPILLRRGKVVILNPDDFYILATKELVAIPPGFAAEMVPYDTMVGEFRVHYAGFFDPGFGYPDGTKAVLEVRSHEVPFALEHEQVVGWLRYEQLAGVPSKLYGSDLGSNYQHQGLTLSKHFRAPG